jgi:alpha/beta superfamily hydrolase
VSDEPGTEPRSIRLRASDGVEVDADLAVAPDAWAGAVVCHPHPAYGGDRHNIVVDRIFRTLATAGVTVLRFDFRPASEGEGDGVGVGVERDVLAGIEQVADHLGPELPLWLVGYSFGADIALSVGDDRVAGWIAVAPPLRFGTPPRPAGGDRRPALVLAAEHDQFSSPDRVRAATSAWPAATVDVVPGADHFLLGAAANVADSVLAWLRLRARPS